MTTHNSTVLLEYGKITAVAGLQWQAVPTGRRGLARLTREKGRQVNRRVVCRGAQRQVAGFCALAGKTHRGSLHSLAMLALPTLGVMVTVSLTWMTVGRCSWPRWTGALP